MKIGRAIYIFEHIDSLEFSDWEKVKAIWLVLNMPTHNSITKDNILKAFKWLFLQFYDVEE